MKKRIAIIILLFSSFVFSQIENKMITKDTLVWKTIHYSCEQGTKDAETDFSNGIYNSYSYGWAPVISTTDNEEFSKFYVNYVREKYAINIEHKGCIVTQQSECYSKTMEKLISKKFGKNIYKRAHKEAEKLFAQNNP